ncbi:polysaccharide biosynthesis/export family protein [Mucilaginibacter sp. UYCu711]|uniref:polysaccharide biosynthesis/export family protein n=1 Tax=Mucilaginibacter sp. UYCu711 TaxID=3156339 RepID=UPI003D230603
MNKNYRFLLFLLTIIYSSCTSYKKVNYFQGLNRNSDISLPIKNYAPITIQPGDILGINVSSLSPEGSAIFNASSNVSTGAQGSDAGNSVLGYLVDEQGNIQLPLIPKIKVGGLTTSEAQSVLQKAILKFLKEPSVNVRLLNFKFSVLGDVAHPGVFNIKNERITLVEALSLAGDLTVTAKRENILLIREIDGERKFVNIDITSSALFNSPYYYLKSNDVLYVEAGKAKYDATSSFTRGLPVFISVISLVLVIFQLAKH